MYVFMCVCKHYCMYVCIYIHTYTHICMTRFVLFTDAVHAHRMSHPYMLHSRGIKTGCSALPYHATAHSLQAAVVTRPSRCGTYENTCACARSQAVMVM